MLWQNMTCDSQSMTKMLSFSFCNIDFALEIAHLGSNRIGISKYSVIVQIGVWCIFLFLFSFLFPKFYHCCHNTQTTQSHIKSKKKNKEVWAHQANPNETNKREWQNKEQTFEQNNTNKKLFRIDSIDTCFDNWWIITIL